VIALHAVCPSFMMIGFSRLIFPARLFRSILAMIIYIISRPGFRKRILKKEEMKVKKNDYIGN
jgi:hypothetical protein